ncbi:hypothetical protein M104_1011 [Bacteroides fragilis str. 1007-1-F |uniref:Uncharacterized protein n=1 Tax=Bacteroides fragilis str. 1007-1-F \|nr:hypothetical protein M101_0845 [Bacteroides fragilis str. 1007-1-F \
MLDSQIYSYLASLALLAIGYQSVASLLYPYFLLSLVSSLLPSYYLSIYKYTQLHNIPQRKFKFFKIKGKLLNNLLYTLLL